MNAYKLGIADAVRMQIEDTDNVALPLESYVEYGPVSIALHRMRWSEGRDTTCVRILLADTTLTDPETGDTVCQCRACRIQRRAYFVELFD